MGFLKQIAGQRIYLDTNIFIYALEGFEIFVDNLKLLFEQIDQGKLEAVTSELTLAETLVKPYRDGNVLIQNVYKSILASSDTLHVIPCSREILINAAQQRALLNIKLPDAIHVATAQQYQCKFFLTNDLNLRAGDDIEVIQLSDRRSL